MAETLDEAMKVLEMNIERLESDTKWACDEIAKLRAENIRLLALNTELSLKNDNLLFWMRNKIQAVVN